ncbi:MAG TPA: gamma-glutamyl-gamma-aminobutyrate hydrolase family protein [Stellaceae bacterium]|nr:gamma-glutamyl-gamma-aminobutyrate hydrolase family protein [Stellaceae bacterium]
MRPRIGITSCSGLRNTARVQGVPIQWVNDKYIRAVSEAAAGLPLLIPAIMEPLDPAELVASLDGLLLTGSPSNVEPHHYGGRPSRPGTLHDPARDASSLPLLRAAIAADLPVLAICRGIQELNVALGGSLHQLVHELPGRLDHRGSEGTVERRYAYRAHPVRLTPGGLLHRLVGEETLMVNSVHSQGIDALAPGLIIEAMAPDGQIEAVRHQDARFVVGVQWHPEYQVLEHEASRALFAAFGAAAARFHEAGLRRPP